jgi:hypothetical protein
MGGRAYPPGVIGLTDQAANVYVTGGLGVVRFDNALQPAGTFSTLPVTTELVFDAAGSAYAGVSSASGPLVKLSSTGELLRSFDTSAFSAFPPIALDLARDQCTLYIADGVTSRVGRYDVCLGRLSPDLASIADVDITTIRILPDDTILVAARSAIHRLDSAGQLLRTYSVPGRTHWDGLAAELDGQDFWSSSMTPGTLVRFSVAGQVLTDINNSGATTLAIIGEQRAAACVATVPSINAAGRFMLAVVLGLVGILRVAGAGAAVRKVPGELLTFVKPFRQPTSLQLQRLPHLSSTRSR